MVQSRPGMAAPPARRVGSHRRAAGQIRQRRTIANASAVFVTASYNSAHPSMVLTLKPDPVRNALTCFCVDRFYSAWFLFFFDKFMMHNYRGAFRANGQAFAFEMCSGK